VITRKSSIFASIADGPFEHGAPVTNGRTDDVRRLSWLLNFGELSILILASVWISTLVVLSLHVCIANALCRLDEKCGSSSSSVSPASETGIRLASLQAQTANRKHQEIVEIENSRPG